MRTYDPIWDKHYFGNTDIYHMATQLGLIKLKGSIGDLTFYESNGMQLVRRKAGPTKQDLENNPRYQRTKENAREFGRIVTTSKCLRLLLLEVFSECADKKVFGRLVSRMSMVIKSDTHRRRGERAVTAQGLMLLTGLECNQAFKFNEQVLIPINILYDIKTGQGVIEQPSFIPIQRFRRFGSSTHAQLIFTIIEFGAVPLEKKESMIFRSAYFSLGSSQKIDRSEILIDQIPQAGNALIVLIGISYFEEIAGAYFPLDKGRYNAMVIAQVYC